MDTKKILIVMFTGFILLVLSCIVMVILINRYLKIQHNVIVGFDESGNLKKLNEKFSIVSPVTDDDSKQETTKCTNKSLNSYLFEGKHEKKPFEIACGNDTNVTSSDFYKQFKNPIIYEQNPPLFGANYMNYNTNPDPTHIDFKLYSDKKTSPVGVNYVD